MGLLQGNDNEKTCPSVSKKFWGHIKNLKRDGTGVSTLQVNGKEMVSGKEKANALNEQYCSVFTSEDLTNIPNLDGEPLPTIGSLMIDTEGVEKLLQGIDPKKG